jgi:hypothetical protein
MDQEKPEQRLFLIKEITANEFYSVPEIQLALIKDVNF